MSDANPFAALVDESTSQNNVNIIHQEKPLNSLLEGIFAFTLDKQKTTNCGYLYVGNQETETIEEEFNLNNLPYYLFERVFSYNKAENLLKNMNIGNFDVHSTEHRMITYLYICFSKYKEEIGNLQNIENYQCIEQEILRNVALAFIHPMVYCSIEKLNEQMIDILLENGMYAREFFTKLCHIVAHHEDADETTLTDIYKRLTFYVSIKVREASLSSFDIRIFNALQIFVCEEDLAKLFLDCCEPSKPEVGSNFALTLLGALFNISILPKKPSEAFKHFLDVTQANLELIEGLLWEKSELIVEHVYQFMLKLLKISPAVKEKTLNWIGRCLNSNSDREKLWNLHEPRDLFPGMSSTICDGFMIQFGNVLLRLCQPVCKENRILKVDPTYCAVVNVDAVSKKIHLPGMSEQTALLPLEENESRLAAASYNFTTECFFMAHRALHLGFNVAVDKAVRMNSELGRIERLYQESVRQSPGGNDFINNLKERLTTEMSKYLSYKTQLCEPTMVRLIFDLISSTCYWLCQVIKQRPASNSTSFAPTEAIPFTFPLSNVTTTTLKCIPEFIVGNVVSFIVFVMRFSSKDFEEQGCDKLEPILTFILAFMGNHGLVKNPHLRAQLAEGLQALLPVYREELGQKANEPNFERTRLFENYAYKKQVIQSLMEVFVGIEMTGQSVEFEQKFNYRRPMYAVMEYLWDKEEYQAFFTDLAQEAEENMEAVTPPIFLRFINLLINDAVFLLDESLTNMAKLREMEAARDNGEWERLPFRERTQNMNFLHHIGMTARFDNILGKDTITALENLTSKITIVFTHSTMVNRIAAMLNYFLLNLVGPNKKNFKVKDQKEYHFDPAEMVLKICKIYINLKDNDDFCLAISQDGRSYRPNLFTLAEDVLIRIGGTNFIHEIQELARKVMKKAEEYQANEEVVAEAPEHFLDPIMSTLMTDPVILPSSRQVVDKTTIARHLLSDQTDPFNRSPLSMDQVIPHIELRNEIEQWIAERQKR